MPHSGFHFLNFWCDLVPKSLILGAPWRPTGPQMAPKIAQVVPIMLQKIDTGPPWDRFWNQIVSKIVFGMLLRIILVDLG